MQKQNGDLVLAMLQSLCYLYTYLFEAAEVAASVRRPEGRRCVSYAAFLAIFLGIPNVLLLVMLRHRLSDKRLWGLLGALVVIALAYMVPWDHLAAVWGLWTWTPLQTWQKKLWAIPLEEYLFCILETMLATLLVYALLVARRTALTRRQNEESLP